MWCGKIVLDDKKLRDCIRVEFALGTGADKKHMEETQRKINDDLAMLEYAVPNKGYYALLATIEEYLGAGSVLVQGE